MPRKLNAGAAAEFIKHYGAAEKCPACGAGDPGVTVWDHYGAVPPEAGTDAEKGVGVYIGAVVSCDNCGHNVTLDRARLDKFQAA